MGSQKHIAVIDDDRSIRNNLSLALLDEGYRVSTFDGAQRAIKSLEAEPPHVIILDILMPRMDGLEFCRSWRENHKDTSIIFLSSLTSEEDKIEALLTGGDDYLSKPFSLKELLIRVDVCLRRIQWMSEIPTITGGKQDHEILSLDKERWRAWLQGNELSLTVSEFRILTALSHRPGQIFTREMICNAAYPQDPYVSERNVDAHIRRIRKKISALSPGTDLIETVYGLGYRFME
ncbi:response regulator transcription factor [Spirochaeta lutea]|uniref:Transcriptional regulator n=1 Tax=Spirochaeta lutea TaxID=1480694 RepID=A0A098R2U2_9SPIO|nr:response regulator transcription factor [Spirochaeta lutea]KGE73988.1 hypothetical protein DC28_02110 [Spirochaeta lutea]